MGRYPFLTAINRLLRETDPFYALSTQKERHRKMRRVSEILKALCSDGKLTTLSPNKLTEADISEFVLWCGRNLHETTAAHYLRFLDEVLQYVGNNVVTQLRVKRSKLLPHATLKAIRTISESDLQTLLLGAYSFDDLWWDLVGKTAISVYSHTGLRVGELRTAMFKDLDTLKSEIRVSNPKGRRKWANDDEAVPIMPGIESTIFDFVEKRKSELLKFDLDPDEVEPLFPYITKSGEVGYWSEPMWEKLKQQLEIASGVSFRWKDFRPHLCSAG